MVSIGHPVFPGLKKGAIPDARLYLPLYSKTPAPRPPTSRISLCSRKVCLGVLWVAQIPKLFYPCSAYFNQTARADLSLPWALIFVSSSCGMSEKNSMKTHDIRTFGLLSYVCACIRMGSFQTVSFQCARGKSPLA